MSKLFGQSDITDVTEVLLKPQAQKEPFSGDSLQFIKIRCLQACCDENGWPLSPPKPIEYGLQFDICPPHLPELEVEIFYSGTHSLKKHYVIEFQKLLDKLAVLDESLLPIQKVEQTILIELPDLRILIKNALEELRPAERHEEQYCEYFFRFEYGKQKIVIKQYTNGKLHLQGRAGDLYQKVLDVIMTLYNRNKINFEDVL